MPLAMFCTINDKLNKTHIFWKLMTALSTHPPSLPYYQNTNTQIQLRLKLHMLYFLKGAGRRTSTFWSFLQINQISITRKIPIYQLSIISYANFIHDISYTPKPTCFSPPRHYQPQEIKASGSAGVPSDIFTNSFFPTAHQQKPEPKWPEAG